MLSFYFMLNRKWPKNEGIATLLAALTCWEPKAFAEIFLPLIACGPVCPTCIGVSQHWFFHWTFRTLHEKEDKQSGQHSLSRVKFFVIALICSFCWYLFPGYLFQSLQSISWVCWAFPNSVTAHQIGSGLNGLGIGAFTLDWTTVASFLFSPLVCPFFAIVNVFVGYALIVYAVIPAAYWWLNLYSAKTFPIFSSHLYTTKGPEYNITLIVNDKFELDLESYRQHGRIHLSTFFALTYGFGFATIASTLTHVALFYGR